MPSKLYDDGLSIPSNTPSSYARAKALNNSDQHILSDLHAGSNQSDNTGRPSAGPEWAHVPAPDDSDTKVSLLGASVGTSSSFSSLLGGKCTARGCHSVNSSRLDYEKSEER